MNRMEDLQPCPFCGGEAMLDVIEPHGHMLDAFVYEHMGGAFIECTAAISGKTAEEATATWNRRTPLFEAPKEG